MVQTASGAIAEASSKSLYDPLPACTPRQSRSYFERNILYAPIRENLLPPDAAEIKAEPGRQVRQDFIRKCKVPTAVHFLDADNTQLDACQ